MKKDIYVFNNGELKRKENTLYFETESGKKFIPVEETNNIWIFGEVTINKKFIDFVSEKNICLHFFNYYGYYTGSFYPREFLNSGFVILKQAESYLDFNKRIEIAKKFIESAIDNIIMNLRYYKSRGIDFNGNIETILNFKNDIKEAKTIGEIMASEGNMRQVYYSCFNNIIRNSDFNFEKRSKRPPHDKINALISFGNALMYACVLGEIYKTQLDPRIGYLHSTNDRSFSLNLDVAEIFKPIIVDRCIFSLLNKNTICKNDFERELGGILLNEKGRKYFVQEFNAKLDTVISHPGLSTTVSYRRIIRMELYKLQKLITEKKEYKPFIARW